MSDLTHNVEPPARPTHQPHRRLTCSVESELIFVPTPSLRQHELFLTVNLFNPMKSVTVEAKSWRLIATWCLHGLIENVLRKDILEETTTESIEEDNSVNPPRQWRKTVFSTSFYPSELVSDLHARKVSGKLTLEDLEQPEMLKKVEALKHCLAHPDMVKHSDSLEATYDLDKWAKSAISSFAFEVKECKASGENDFAKVHQLAEDLMLPLILMGPGETQQTHFDSLFNALNDFLDMHIASESKNLSPKVAEQMVNLVSTMANARHSGSGVLVRTRRITEALELMVNREPITTPGKLERAALRSTEDPKISITRKFPVVELGEGVSVSLLELVRNPHVLMRYAVQNKMEPQNLEKIAHRLFNEARITVLRVLASQGTETSQVKEEIEIECKTEQDLRSLLVCITHAEDCHYLRGSRDLVSRFARNVLRAKIRLNGGSPRSLVNYLRSSWPIPNGELSSQGASAHRCDGERALLLLKILQHTEKIVWPKGA